MSEKQVQHAEPSPSLSSKSSTDLSFLGLFQDLFPGESQYSQDLFLKKNNQIIKNKQPKKTRKISKEYIKRNNSTIKDGQTKESKHKKFIRLQNRIKQLQAQLKKMQIKYERCPHCYCSLNSCQQKRQCNLPLIYDEQIVKVVNSIDSPRSSRESMQFQKIDFTSMQMNRCMDDKGWIFLGTLMIAMGSKCMDVDGTINVYKILKQSVDNLRKQVDKSMPNISMDFYLCKQEMQQNLIPQEIGFDPFMQKPLTNGLFLEGLKIQSVEQFQLFYDNKLTYNIKYESLLTAMQYVREGCWISSQ